MASKLLIQSCSNRKTAGGSILPALELYDGVNYRVIKKFFRENPYRKQEVRILILSAEYGLISAETKLRAYDKVMCRKRAQELKQRINRRWEKEIGDIHKFRSIFVNLGRIYLTALGDITLPAKTVCATGGIGERQKQLKEWLNN